MALGPNTFGAFPSTRMRRTRMKEFSRRLCRETILTPDNLIMPVFVLDGKQRKEPIPSMPGIHRLSLDHLKSQIKLASDLGIPAVAVFPVVGDAKKSNDAKGAWDSKGLVPSAIKAIKDTT